MSSVPTLPRFQPQEATPADIAPFSDALPKRNRWLDALQKLLRPKLVENAVLIADVIFIMQASLVCSFGYHWATTETGGLTNISEFAGLGIIVAVNFAAVMTARRNYQLKNLALFTRQARETIFVLSGVYGLLAVVGFAMKISSDFSRGSVILAFVGGLATLLSLRMLVVFFIATARESGSFARKKIIVVAEHNPNASSRSLIELRSFGYCPVKTCEVSREEMASPGITPSLRNKLAEVIQIARDERIEDIYLLFEWHHRRAIDGIVDALAVLPVSVHLIPDESAARFLNYPIANVGSTWTAELKRSPLSRTERSAKRCFDIIVATLALLALLPLTLITAFLIKFDSPGPVLFRQKRNGFNGQTFNIFKFRTMHVLEDGPVVRQATRNDPRITGLGRWLRRTSIDELPQLINVIRGDMSLVGPRPHATSHNSEYEKLIANYAFRHHVKPGLTGWAQIKGYRGETRQIEQMERRVEHDIWYINNWSLWFDLKIVLRTILVALIQDTAY